MVLEFYTTCDFNWFIITATATAKIFHQMASAMKQGSTKDLTKFYDRMLT